MKKLNPVLNDLISLFSYNVVFAPKDETVNLSIQDIVNIYNILNKHIFSSSLKILPMRFANEFVGTNHLAGYSYRFVLLKDANSYALVTKPTRIPNGKILMPPSILLNPCLSSGITLMLVVNSLVHEMIHQDDVENGTLLQRKYDSKMKGEKDFNSHKGYFENFANSVNAKFNLDVKEIGSRMSDEAIMSIEAVRKALLEKEHENTAVSLNEHEYAKLSDDEKLKRSKENLENDEFVECKYLGNGAFEEILF